jgi:hypothetical protein
MTYLLYQWVRTGISFMLVQAKDSYCAAKGQMVSASMSSIQQLGQYL